MGFHDVMVGLAALAQDILSGLPLPAVGGFGATATNPVSLKINLGAGRIYSSAPADAVAAGSIPQDLTNIIQQGQNAGQTLTLVPPAAGQSQWNLVQVQFSQADSVRINDPNGGTVPFYNSSNPTVPNNVAINTVRQGLAIIQVIQSAAATTGSEVPPTPTAGWTPLYLIDLAGGQTTISTPQIIKAGPSAGTGVPSNYPVAPFIAGLLASHHSGNSGQAPRVYLGTETQGTLPYGQMSPVRTLVSSALTLYVNGSTGNDSTNNGLSSGAPFKTIGRAIAVTYQNYDHNGTTPTVSVANGTYPESVTCIGLPVGSKGVNITGNPSSPGSCAINAASSWCIGATAGAIVTVSGFTVAATGAPATGSSLGGSGLAAVSGGSLSFGTMVFGACGGYHMAAITSGIIGPIGGTGQAYTISGNAVAHVYSDYSSTLNISGSTITIDAGITVSTAFALASACASVAAVSLTVGGSTLTGPKFIVTQSANIYTNTANVSYLPGSTAGTQTLGGQYS